MVSLALIRKRECWFRCFYPCLTYTNDAATMDTITFKNHKGRSTDDVVEEHRILEETSVLDMFSLSVYIKCIYNSVCTRDVREKGIIEVLCLLTDILSIVIYTCY